MKRQELRVLAYRRAADDIAMIERASVAEQHPDLTDDDLDKMEDEFATIVRDFRARADRLSS